MKRVSRAQLRGKPLDKDCYGCNISKNEYGPNDNRCFCYGLVDPGGDSIDKCRGCGAFADNAKAPRRDEK